MNWFTAVPAALLGLAAGSFLNVVVCRLPRGESIVRPRSRCPECGRPLGWRDNIPVVSYIMLKGRCRSCRCPISPRYPAVELLGSALAVVSVAFYGVGFEAVFVYAFMMALLAVTLIDWDHRIIPDSISISFIFVGVAWSLYSPTVTLTESVAGAAAGGGALWLTGEIYRRLRHADGMGGGDVKLMAMIGAFLGIGLVLPVILIASFLGSIYGIYLMRKGGGGQTSVAFGSFLAPAAAICLLFGADILHWYTSGFWS